MLGEPQRDDEPALPSSEPHGKRFIITRSFRIGSGPLGESSAEASPDRASGFEWRLGRPRQDDDRLEGKPVTYYEALSGRRDPQREFFIRARRIINTGATVIAIAFPVILVAGAIIAGADLQTIVVVGIGGAVVGLMFKSSFPRTPFG